MLETTNQNMEEEPLQPLQAMKDLTTRVGWTLSA